MNEFVEENARLKFGRSRTAVAVAAAVLVFGATACGGSDDAARSSGSDDSSAAVDSTKSDDTASNDDSSDDAGDSGSKGLSEVDASECTGVSETGTIAVPTEDIGYTSGTVQVSYTDAAGAAHCLTGPMVPGSSSNPSFMHVSGAVFLDFGNRSLGGRGEAHVNFIFEEAMVSAPEEASIQAVDASINIGEEVASLDVASVTITAFDNSLLSGVVNAYSATGDEDEVATDIVVVFTAKA